MIAEAIAAAPEPEHVRGEDTLKRVHWDNVAGEPVIEIWYRSTEWELCDRFDVVVALLAQAMG